MPLLLDAVEARIGSLETWSTSILTVLFSFDSHMPRSLKTICAFFFGNNIPFSLACQFFAGCSYHTYALVEHNFGVLYDIWTESERGPRPLLPSQRLLKFDSPRCRYYDMYEGRFKYADGTYVPEF